ERPSTTTTSILFVAVIPTAVRGCRVSLKSTTSWDNSCPSKISKGPPASATGCVSVDQPPDGLATTLGSPALFNTTAPFSLYVLNPLTVWLTIAPSYLKNTVEPPVVVLK